MIECTKSPRENGSGTFRVTFRDELDVATVPTSATWTLSDQYGNVINSRADVAISPLASTVRIVISGLDLAFQSATDNGERRLALKWTYDSLSGTGLPGREEARFFVENLVNEATP